MRRINKKGFTLIELLAVIVILGILMLIAIPSVTRFINQSKEKTFKSNAQMLIDAVRNDAVSNNKGKCYAKIDSDDIKLEKGSKDNLVGFVYADYDANSETYTFKIAIKDTKDNLSFGASAIQETAISDATVQHENVTISQDNTYTTSCAN